MPTTLQDVVIVFVTVSGRNNGQLVQETYANKIYSRDVDGRTLSAIQITTAAAICTVLDLLATGQLPQSGFIRQEDIPLKVFLENRFGQVYAKPETGVPHHEFRRLRAMMSASLAQRTSVRDEALAILSRLGGTESAFAREGILAASPITGEFIAHVTDHKPGGGERSHRPGHASL